MGLVRFFPKVAYVHFEIITGMGWVRSLPRYTVNFQNNAQVQIYAWFKLKPGTKHNVYNL